MDKIIYCVLNLCLFLHKSRAKRVTNDKRGTEHVRQATQIKASSSALDVTQRNDSYSFPIGTLFPQRTMVFVFLKWLKHRDDAQSARVSEISTKKNMLRRYDMISRHFLTRVFGRVNNESFECLSSSEKPADTSDFQKQCGPATACLQLSSHKDRPVDALSSSACLSILALC